YPRRLRPSLQIRPVRGDALIFYRICEIGQVGRNRHTADDRHAPGEPRLLGIRTQRTRPDGWSLDEGDLIRGGREVHAFRRYWSGGDAVFNPICERREQIKLVGRSAARAMTHVRDRVEA